MNAEKENVFVKFDIDNLNFSNTVQNHTGRPYQDSILLIKEQ